MAETQMELTVRVCERCGGERFLRTEKCIVQLFGNGREGIDRDILGEVKCRYECLNCLEGWDE